MINYTDKITDHFTWGEALYLPSMDMYAEPTQEQIDNIIDMANVLEVVRSIFGRALIIHNWIRTNEYNLFLRKLGYKTASKSQHLLANATDFHIAGLEGVKGCDYVRAILLPKLDELNIRMEDRPVNWVHIDRGPVIRHRYFKP